MIQAFSYKIKIGSLSEILAKLSIVSIFLSFYFYLFFEAKFGVSNLRILLLALSYFLFTSCVIIKKSINIFPPVFLYFSLSPLIYIISSPFWFVKFDINVYLSTISAVLIIHDYIFFKKILKYFLYLTLILAVYEFIGKQYLFVVFRETTFGLRALDEKLFGGLSGVFRAKVFFEGPLALSQFAIGAAFLFRQNIRTLFIIFLISIFANGRLGMIICGVLIALYYVKQYSLLTLLLKPKYFLLLSLGLVLSFVVAYMLLDESSLERFKNSFNTSNEGNAARITFWINGIKTWLSYDLENLIFGNNGYFGSIYKNNAENGWITLLVNNGIIGFMYYFIPVLLLLINYLIKASVYFWYILLLLFCMFVQTFHLGASANLFYWLIIFSFLVTTHDGKLSL